MSNLGSITLSAMLAVAAGGAIGAVARFWLSTVVDQMAKQNFPLGTLTVNALGSFLFGLLSILIIKSQWFGEYFGEHGRLLLLTGGLGAFTTFSTFSGETLSLLMDQRLALAGLNILANVTVCLLAAWLGLSMAQRL